MSAAISWHDWIDAVCASVPAEVHPAGHGAVNRFTSQMLAAAMEQDFAEVARLTDNIKHKLKTELRYVAENKATLERMKAKRTSE